MKKIFNERTIAEFDKDFKKLKKRFKTLDEDFRTFTETQLVLYHLQNIDNGGIKNISSLNVENHSIFKAKKFACKALKGTASNSGIRIIYEYNKENNEIIFIEIYFKSDKENEDTERIKRYLK